MRSRPVTRADVAAAAGTSTAVVSYVLNDGPRPVAPETRRRVLDAVERLGYRPNALAAGLSARRTRLLGLVVPDLTIPFFAQMTTGLAGEASRRGLTVLTVTSAWDAEREVDAIEEFVRLRVRGVLLAPVTGRPSAERTLRESGVATVLISGDPGELPLPRVASDAFAAGRLATRHLLEHGYDDVACLAVPHEATPAGPRVAGWRATVGSDSVLVRAEAFDRYAAERAATALLARSAPPLAVMVVTDEAALGLLAAAARLGWRVPEDCAMVGCDGIPEGRLVHPPLTTVEEPVETLCASALDRLEGGDGAPEPALAPVRLRVGGTCGCEVSARDPS